MRQPAVFQRYTKADIDKSFQLNPPFLGLWALSLLIILPILKPWDWELPLISKVAGTILIPFFAAILIYVPIAFCLAVKRSGHRGKEVLLAFIAVIALEALVAVIAPAIWLIGSRIEK